MDSSDGSLSELKTGGGEERLDHWKFVIGKAEMFIRSSAFWGGALWFIRPNSHCDCRFDLDQGTVTPTRFE
jgi:hypothetical protein